MVLISDRRHGTSESVDVVREIFQVRERAINIDLSPSCGVSGVDLGSIDAAVVNETSLIVLATRGGGKPRLIIHCLVWRRVLAADRLGSAGKERPSEEVKRLGRCKYSRMRGK